MKDKRGLFFTVIVIFIITLFFMSYTLYDVIVDRSSTDRRVETLNNFVYSIEEDIPRYLFIAGFRSLFLMEEKIVAENNYISNVNSTFQELFYNGTLDGEEKEIMFGAKFSDMEFSFDEVADKVNANVSLSSPSISMDQIDPWHVYVSFSVYLEIEDLSGLVKWNKTAVYDTVIPIEGFEDPIYLIETGVVTNKVIPTPYEVFTSGSDVSNLSDHVDNSYYVASDSAPSFLKRMEGNFSADENGIESFVKIPKLTAVDITPLDKTTIDYIYFSGDNPTYYRVSGMPSWFKIDNEDGHLDKYNVSSLIY